MNVRATVLSVDFNIASTWFFVQVELTMRKEALRST